MNLTQERPPEVANESVLKYLDVAYESRHTPMLHHVAGRSWTRTGYGKKIPTPRMIRIEGETCWRRVYCCIYSNIGTSYIIRKGEWVVVR